MAELLITIGIIGVVAAITISALGLNVSSKKFQTQLKKSLSSLDQAAISAQARYYTDYSSLSTESNDSTCSSDKLASGNQTMCALFNTTLSAKSYLGVYGTSVRSFIGLGLYRINTQTINPNGYLVYSLSDGSFVGFNPKAKNCSIGAGTSFTSEFLTEGNLSDCLGFIDVNGASLPNREVLCSEGETVLDPIYPCKVKNVKGDVFPVVFHDGKVEPASNAARLAFFGGNIAKTTDNLEKITIIDPKTGNRVNIPKYKKGSNGLEHEYDETAGKYVIKNENGQIISYINQNNGKTYTYCRDGKWYEATKEVNGKTYEFSDKNYTIANGTRPLYIIKNADGTIENADNGKTYTYCRDGKWYEPTKEVNGKTYEFSGKNYALADGTRPLYVIKNADGTIESADNGKTYTRCGMDGRWYEPTKEENGKTYEFSYKNYWLADGTRPLYIIKNSDGTIENADNGKTYTRCGMDGRWYEPTKEVDGKTYEFSYKNYVLADGAVPLYVIKNADGTIENADNGKTYTRGSNGRWHEVE